MRTLLFALIAACSTTSATALRPTSLVSQRRPKLRHSRALSPQVLFTSIDGQPKIPDAFDQEDCAVVDPDAINLLACHFIAHHRSGIVEFVNKVAFPPRTFELLNSLVGDLLTCERLRFDITGPLEPQNYFRCYEVNVMRSDARDDLIDVDLTVEYKNRLCLTMDALRHRGAIRGNSTLASAYRWVTRPIQGTSPLTCRLQGHGEGVCKIRLTLQTAQGVAFPTPAHLRVTDASQMRIILDDYDVSYLGPAGVAARFIAGNLPLIQLEKVVNNAVQDVFENFKDGWAIGAGVQAPRTGAWSKRRTQPAPTRRKKGYGYKDSAILEGAASIS